MKLDIHIDTNTGSKHIVAGVRDIYKAEVDMNVPLSSWRGWYRPFLYAAWASEVANDGFRMWFPDWCRHVVRWNKVGAWQLGDMSVPVWVFVEAELFFKKSVSHLAMWRDFAFRCFCQFTVSHDKPPADEEELLVWAEEFFEDSEWQTVEAAEGSDDVKA